MPSEPEGSLSPGGETCHLAELRLPHTGHRGSLPEPLQGLEGLEASHRVLPSAVQTDAAGGRGSSTRVGSCLDRSIARGLVPANTIPAAMLSGFAKARGTV